MTTAPRAFLSHSHQDRALAHDLGKRLRSAGVDIWVDSWEISPGDSIVQKIFEEGLRDCGLFIILLTQASIKSNWVRHELDSAIVQRLSGATRVVPVVGEPCDIPVALRTLLRLDLAAESIDSVVRRLVDTAFGRDQKPALGPPPSSLAHDVPGLSRIAGHVATLLAASMDQPDGSPIGYDGAEISQRLSLSPEQVNDAVDELASLGLVSVARFIGTAPYDFGSVEATASMAFQLRGTGVLDYDPEDDVRMVAAAVTQKKALEGEGLQEITKLTPSRINHAVTYLEDYGLVEVSKFLGTAPFDFGEVRATAATRRFVAENSR
jgi:hypothetical protein